MDEDQDSFYTMYNKEIKVNQSQIPIILAELTDAAFNFISREQFEKALVLLQKTEGVLEVVNLETS
jgi:tetratricopeptide (TPR) repeat protein